MDAKKPYTLFAGSLDMAAGLIVGLTSAASGYAIGVLGDAGVRAIPKQPRLFVGLTLVLVFAEIVGLFGLVVGVIVHAKAGEYSTCS